MTELFASLSSEAVVGAIRDADRLATLAIFGERGALTTPESVSFNAGATELVAARLARVGGDEAIQACRVAFDLLRGVLSDPQLAGERTPLAEERLMLRAACFGVLADRPSQTRQLLSRVAPDLELPIGWGDRVHTSAMRIWQRLIRKQGWDDLDEVRQLIQGLRADQEEHEPPYLEASEGSAGVAWHLIASYHLVRAAEIVADFTENGEVDGHFDPLEQAQMHFDRARDAADQAADGELAFIAIVLELSVARMISNSIWTAARGAGTRAQQFVRELASRARPYPEAARCPTCDAAHRNCDWCDAACSDPWHTPGMNAAICPTCGSDDPNRFDDGCADTGQPVGMDLGGHLIYGEPDAWHGVQDE